MHTIKHRNIALFISLFASVCLVLSAGAAYAAPSEWAAEGVAKAIELGFVDESLQSAYQEPISRKDFCRLAVTLYEKSVAAIDGAVSFYDTNDEYVGKAAHLKIVNGISEGIFDPNGKLTREQAATILARLLNALGKPAPSSAADFVDAASISSWAKDAVGTMQLTGIMQGSNNKFSPKELYTVEQSILTLLRILEFKEIKEVAKLRDYYSFKTETHAGVSMNILRMFYSSGKFHPIVMQANGKLISAQPIKEMAAENGASIAVNGTYFDAYSGNPVPLGTIIKNGKTLHLADNKATIAFKYDGTTLIDRIAYNKKIYVNNSSESAFTPWTINKKMSHEAGIALYTEEYTEVIEVMQLAKAYVLNGDKVSAILTGNTTVPSGGSVVLFNPVAASKYAEWHTINIGDTLTLKCDMLPTYDDKEKWQGISYALSAGPLLLKDGKIVADPAAEGFTEDKILTQRNGRTFIGIDAAGNICIGYATATIAELAAACKELGLKDAMCLDGGGSTAIYADGAVIIEGRPVNNGLGFEFSK